MRKALFYLLITLLCAGGAGAETAQNKTPKDPTASSLTVVYGSGGGQAPQAGQTSQVPAATQTVSKTAASPAQTTATPANTSQTSAPALSAASTNPASISVTTNAQQNVSFISAPKAALSLAETFANPPKSVRPYTMWWMNGSIDQATIDYQIAKIDEMGFGGVTPLAMLGGFQPNTSPAYRTPEYYDSYVNLVEKCRELGLQMLFYDDANFPSGIAGGAMKTTFSDDLQKQLWQGKLENTGASAEILAPVGTLKAVYAYDPATKQFDDITPEVSYLDIPESQWQGSGGACRDTTTPWLKKKIVWNSPSAGKTMLAYVCAQIADAGTVDYLNPESVRKFMTLTYDEMDAAFAGRNYWGEVFKSTFYDDISIYGTADFSQWSDTVDEAFRDKYGFYPYAFYPYFYNANPEIDDAKAGAMRSMAFDVRSELFAKSYPGTTEEWCAERGMTTSGHCAGAYERNPLVFGLDSIKFYKYSGAVLTDSIHGKDFAVKGIKIPVSAAVNYDKPMVYCETYGNFQPDSENDGLMLYRGAIDMYARGVNCIVAHGTWLTDTQVATIPEISWRNPKMADEIPAYTEWAGRVQSIMQGGAQVAEIAVVYPIRTLEANYKFTRNGIVSWEELPYADYIEVGQILTGGLKRGFHFLHPDVIAERCGVEGASLTLDNRYHPQKYKAVILPKCEYMNLAEMQKIKAFHDAGGLVIATGVVPSKSANVNVEDSEIQALSAAIFTNGNGILVAQAHQELISRALSGSSVAWEYFGSNNILGDDIACMQYKKDGRDFYFIGNSSKQKATVTIKIKGRSDWQLWNPHTGEISEAKPSYQKVKGTEYALFKLTLDPGRSMFASRPSQD